MLVYIVANGENNITVNMPSFSPPLFVLLPAANRFKPSHVRAHPILPSPHLPLSPLQRLNAMQSLEKRIHHRNIHHQAPTTNIDYNKYQPPNTSDTPLSRFTLLECTKFNEEETAPFIDDDLCKLMIHPVGWKEILCVKKSCNCTKIDPQDVHCVVRGGSIVVAVIRMPWGDDMGEGSRREVDDLIHLKVRKSKIARARLAKRG